MSCRSIHIFLGTSVHIYQLVKINTAIEYTMLHSVGEKELCCSVYSHEGKYDLKQVIIFYL